MVTDKNDYLEIKKSIVKYSDDLISKDELDSFNEHIVSKLSDFKPTLMIYGTYNSGKSTLLNALFGEEEKAKTGDAPETAQVHGYQYNGYTIYDTPGINAPIKHEEVTTEHLNKSEIVLFVMSNDGSFEEEYVYDRISEIVKSKKPIIIVLNNKRGIEPSSIEAIEEINKVNINLSKIGDRNNIEKIENKVSLCMLNAKTALKGKLENKNLILKKSNILKLEKMIEKLLDESGHEEVKNALNIYIQNFIYSIIDKIDNKIDNVEVQKVEELITYLEKFKQSSEVKLKNIVSRKMPILVDNITTMLLKDGTLENDINFYITSVIEDIYNKAEDISKNIKSNLEIKIDDFSQEFKSINAEYADINISRKSNESEENFYISDNIKNQIGNTLKDKKVIEESAKQVLIKAKDWLPKSVMQGKGPVWISKAAGKAAIGLSLAIEAHNIYSANKEHQQMIENERNRILGVKNSAETLADNIQSSLFNSIDDVIADTFNNLIFRFKDESKKLNHDNASLIIKKESLQSLLNKL